MPEYIFTFQAQSTQQCGMGAVKPASVSKETTIALGSNSASPSSDKGQLQQIVPKS